MPFLTPPVTDEPDALATFLEQQCAQLRVSALGLDDEQARRTLPPSELSIAGLLAHSSQVIAGWVERIRIAPQPLEAERLFALGEELGLGTRFLSGAELPADAPIGRILKAFDHAVSRIRPTIRSVDLDARVPVPDAPWFPKDLESWNARWVCQHLIAEIARHAGHADLIRESIDGEIAYSLNTRAEGKSFDWESYRALRN